MMRWPHIATAVLMGCALAVPVHADDLQLTTGGTDLGRVLVSSLSGGLTLSFDLGGDAPDQTYVIARFQNNQPLMLAADGVWENWSGLDEDLVPAPVTIDKGHLTVPVLAPGISDLFTPATFTVAYRTADGMRSGTIVVDGQ